MSLQWLVTLKYQLELTSVLKNNVEACLKTKTSQPSYWYDIHGIKFPLNTSKDYLALIASKKSKLNKNIALELFLNNSLFNDVPGKQNEKIHLFAPMLEKLEKHTPDYFSLLAQIYFYAQLGNQAKVNFYLNQIYILDLHSNIFSPNILSIEQGKKVIENILATTKYLEKYLEESIKYEMLLLVTKRFFLKEYEEFAHFFDVERSLHSLREESRKITSGLIYPTIWFPLLLERTSLNEAVDYLEKALQLPIVKSQIQNFLWLFEYHYPRDEQLRADILKLVAELNDSHFFYQKDLFFRLMENISIKNHYSEVNQKYKRPIFVEKRAFYLSMLESNTAVSYAIYNLLFIGDYNLDYIHWLSD
ncbi:MAG: hypothetical protein JNM93_12345 [Bacteriovoracaceae bacterium]|nr:hypothetical protein [Bacteriovoracaceae bacterium]